MMESPTYRYFYESPTDATRDELPLYGVLGNRTSDDGSFEPPESGKATDKVVRKGDIALWKVASSAPG